jgi:hypothetical protein
MVLDDRAADAAYLAMANHFDGCEQCVRAGAELADPGALCDAGRAVLERWLNEDFRAADAVKGQAK